MQAHRGDPFEESEAGASTIAMTCHPRSVLTKSADEVLMARLREPTYDVILADEAGITVHHTAPLNPPAMIAREYPTPDGRRRIEYEPGRAASGSAADVAQPTGAVTP